MWDGGVEYTVVGVEEDVAVDVLVATTDGLETAEAAAGFGGRSEVEEAARDRGVVALTDQEGDVGESSRAVEDVAAIFLGVGSAGNLLVVGVDSGIGHEEEGGSGVRDTDLAFHGASLGADLEGGGVVLPETTAVVDRGVLDRARVLGAVGVSEVVLSVGLRWEVGSEEGRVERLLSIVEESLCLLGLNWMLVSHGIHMPTTGLRTYQC